MPPSDADAFLRRALQRAQKASIVQLCVSDHSDQAEPHIHVQVHLRTGADRTTATPWQVLSEVSTDALRESLARVVGPNSIRFHMHDQPKQKRVSPEFLELLWSCSATLTEDESAALAADGHGNCPVCLCDLSAGDDIVCMPCEGMHTGHWSCLQPWLQKASTCPCCRFELPLDTDAKDNFEALIEKSLSAISKLKDSAKQHSIASSLAASRLQRSHARIASLAPIAIPSTLPSTRQSKLSSSRGSFAFSFARFAPRSRSGAL